MAESIRLSQLLPDRLDSIERPIRERLCQDKEVNGLALAWEVVGGKVQEALKSALDCNVVDILAECWSRAPQVAELLASAGRLSDDSCIIELGEHELSHELNPVVAVRIGSCPCIELNFALTVSARIGGAQLSIVNGHIASGELGEAWAGGQLSYEGIPLHSELESRKLSIGGGFEFTPPGIAIPGLGRPAHEAAAR